MNYEREDIEKLLGSAGSLGSDIEASLSPAKPPLTRMQKMMRNRPLIKSEDAFTKTKELTGFHDRHPGWRIPFERFGPLHRIPGGKAFLENQAKKREGERKVGNQESASCGVARFGQQTAELYAMHWEVKGGSFGVVAGEKFQKAVDVAIRKRIPLVGLYESGGARQEENFPALLQMTRMVESIRRFREKSDQLYVSLLRRNVWGGISASAVPLADLIIGEKGTDFGFAGSRVIEAYEGKPVEKGEQSVEAHLFHRNVDVLTGDPTESHDFVTKLFSLTNKKKEKFQLTPQQPFETKIPPTQREKILAKPLGFSSPLVVADGEPTIIVERREPQVIFEASQLTKEELKDKLYEQYLMLSRDPERIDTESIMSGVFTDFLSLYNSYTTEEKTEYPAIIAGLGKLGTQTFLVIGDQPSYQHTRDGIRKIPASPAPEDSAYMQRMLELGKRAELPVIFLTDTLGAKPTIDAERRGQASAIAKAILAGIDYPHPVISLVTGALGSGGGLMTTPFADHVAMLENAMAFVAEARSSASISFKTPDPSVVQIKETLLEMFPTADDQKRLDIIDEVIPEGSKMMTLKNIRDMIAVEYTTLSKLSTDKLRERRSKRIRDIKGIPVAKEKAVVSS